MRLKCRCGKDAEEGRTTCFNCRVRTVGFTFVGGGGYTRDTFHNYTTAERRTEILGDNVVGVDVEPTSTYGR